jgi:hypothetical protein
MEFYSKKHNMIFLSILGVNFKIGKFATLGICDEMTTDYLINFLSINNTETIVFDFSAIVYKNDQKVFERIFSLTQSKDRRIIFFNVEEELQERLIKNLENDNYKYNLSEINDLYFSSKSVCSVKINNDDPINEIQLLLKENDFKILKSCSINYPDGIQLKSTSFWTNYYFNISKIFLLNPTNSAWILARLCDKIRKSTRTNKNILMVSTSLFGTILSTIMKEIFSDNYIIETICFDRLGPDLLINEINIHKKDSYDCILYICDFIIGGTELKILKALLALRKLEITHIFAIGTFSDPNDYKLDHIHFENIAKTCEICPDIIYSLIKEDKHDP